MKKTVYLFLFNSLAEWEIGFVASGINNPMMQLDPDRYQLKTFTVDGKPIRTIGGLQITPDLSMAEVKDAEMLILPGGTSWDQGGNREVLPLAVDFHQKQIKVAAICGATFALAQSGLLDSVKHTSNAKEYLLASGYRGAENYVDAAAVSDQGIITASGTDSLEFAREIFSELNLYKAEVLDAWYRLFKTSAPEAYAELMGALGV